MAAVLGLSPLFASGARPCGRFCATRSKASSLLFHGGRHTSTSRSFYFANLSNKPMSVKSSKMFPKTRGTIDSQTSESTEVDKKDSSELKKTPFGYTRKDVLLIGLGVTVVGVALKNGLEFVGLDSLQAGNVVQLVIVLGLTIGWISTYVFRVSNKEMTYAQQLRDYENKVMQKRLEGLTEGELEELLAQVEEEKQQLSGSEQIK